LNTYHHDAIDSSFPFGCQCFGVRPCSAGM
jgi:hypothetical protein